MCRDKKSFTEITSTNVKNVNLANDESACATVTGTVSIITSNDINEQINLRNVLHVPTLYTNLMSIAKITDKGHQVTFQKDRAVISNSNSKIRFIADRKGDLYFVRNTREYAHNASIEDKSDKLKLWHDKLGHLNTKDVIHMSNRGIISKVNSSVLNCSTCLQGKLTALPFPKRLSRSTHKLEIIHSNLVVQ